MAPPEHTSDKRAYYFIDPERMKGWVGGYSSSYFRNVLWKKTGWPVAPWCESEAVWDGHRSARKCHVFLTSFFGKMSTTEVSNNHTAVRGCQYKLLQHSTEVLVPCLSKLSTTEVSKQPHFRGCQHKITAFYWGPRSFVKLSTTEFTNNHTSTVVVNTN